MSSRVALSCAALCSTFDPLRLQILGRPPLALAGISAQCVRMRSNSVDSLLMIMILVGVAISIFNLVLAMVNGRSSRKAEIKQAAGIREMYQRTYNRGRRLVSGARIARAEKRAPPAIRRD